MTVKKKLLIALLSTTCVAAGVAGLAACKDKSGNDSYTVTAVDQYNNPVAGVVFRIGYYDAQEGSTIYVKNGSGETLTATTDKSGKAYFKGFTPEEGIDYSAYLAELDERAYPYGYRNENMSVEFDESGKATYEFKYLPSSYYDNLVSALEYKRTFDDSDYVEGNDESMKYVENGSATLTLDLKKDVHSYFTFLSYRELGTTGAASGASEDEIQAQVYYNQLWGTRAAAGVYTVTFTAASNTPVTMYNFHGDGYVLTDDNGIPENKIKTVSGKTNSITLELTISNNYARATQYFGLYATNDCKVNVTVERTGDAEEPPEIEKTVIPAPENLTQQTAQSGSLTLMNVDGSLAAVLGDDGYYHVGSKTGPVLYANLTKTLTRVGELSIIDLGSDKNPNAQTAFIFYEYEDGELKAIYDYSEFLKEYAKNVNSDGVYPVDGDLYTFLQIFATKGQMAESVSAGAYAWLLPCQYYAPEEGLEVTGEGTAANPYVLLGLLNNASSLIGEEIFFTYTATTDGVYSFKLDKNNMFASLDVVETDIKSFKQENEYGDILTYVILKNNQSVKLKLTDFFTSASIDVGNAAKDTVAAVSGDVNDSKGMNTDNAIQLKKTGYTAYIVENSVCEDGVWVYVQPMLSGTINYTLEVKGSPFAQIVYNGQTYGYGEKLELTCMGGQKYAFLLTAKNNGHVENGIYAIDWQVVEDQSPVGGEMSLGDNHVSLSASQSYNGAEYTFTSEEGGKFVIKTDNEDAYISGEGFEINGAGSYQFTLEAGGTLTFSCAGPYNTATEYDVTIEPYQVTNDESFTDNGGTKHITLDLSNCDNGVEFTFLSTTGGTFTISVASGTLAMINVNSSDSGDRNNMPVINTSNDYAEADKIYSYEFTLQPGGYITFIAFVPGYIAGEYDVTIARK